MLGGCALKEKRGGQGCTSPRLLSHQHKALIPGVKGQVIERGQQILHMIVEYLIQDEGCDEVFTVASLYGLASEGLALWFSYSYMCTQIVYCTCSEYTTLCMLNTYITCTQYSQMSAQLWHESPWVPQLALAEKVSTLSAILLSSFVPWTSLSHVVFMMSLLLSEMLFANVGNFGHRIIELFYLEGTFKGHLVLLPCNEQGQPQLDQVAPEQ